MRDLLRAIVQEVVVNPDTNEAEITLLRDPTARRRRQRGRLRRAREWHRHKHREDTAREGHVLSYVYGGGRIRTYDLRVMSPTSYQLLHPAVEGAF